jgi:crossover junction endodeoxyribonuclease RuvC
VTYSVGIDQSYTGFAVTKLFNDGTHETTCVALKGEGVARLSAAQKIIYTLKPWDVSEVAMEGYSFGSANRAHMAGELGGAVKLALQEINLVPLIVPPSSVKKYATGKGNAKKDLMILACYKNWGVEFSNDNEADSYCIAKIAAGHATNAAQEQVVKLIYSK